MRITGFTLEIRLRIGHRFIWFDIKYTTFNVEKTPSYRIPYKHDIIKTKRQVYWYSLKRMLIFLFCCFRSYIYFIEAVKSSLKSFCLKFIVATDKMILIILFVLCKIYRIIVSSLLVIEYLNARIGRH